ncbi:MAG: glycosyltransferase family A protein [Pseudomonadota bacterium]|nr:MAG: glycosyl transferase [Pseudomonadota bacterium]
MALGLVAIGRNEGERLERCLASALEQVDHVVYVDSGSTDDSVARSWALGADVVELDARLPFTAARARNAGFARLKERVADLEFVQFVDGDCELHPTWIRRALATMRERPDAAIVCGRRRERYPERSVYNHLCDIEWATPVGEASECGGDFLVRASAFEEVSGFRPELIAGEEPDLCHRLRQRGYRILRIEHEMTLHDSAMSRFSQWWRRNVRSGHASAEAFHLRGSVKDPRSLKPVVSNFVWALPAAWPLWPVLWWRVFRRAHDPTFATFIVLGKLPHFQGQLQYWLDRARGTTSGLVEYK